MIPIWQTILSWIYPLNIEKVNSSISGELQVNLQYGNLVVDTETANYSFGNLHLIFQEAIYQLNLSQEREYKVLILGFGAGSIANILINENGLNCTITGIELDNEIIKLSKKYFFTNLKKQTTVLNTDALEFVKTNTASYDLVFVDLFIDTQVPITFQTIDFLKGLKKTISPNGQVLMNSLKNGVKLLKNWEQVFKHFDIIKVQGNQVLYFTNRLKDT